MNKLFLGLVLTVAFGAIAGCKKLETPPNPTGGSAPMDFSGVTKAIPLDQGRLVGVTQLENRLIAILWFERPDQTITAVRVNVSTGAIYSATITVPRK